MKVLGLVTYRVYPALMGGQKGVTLFYKYLQQHVAVCLAVSTDNELVPETKNAQLLLHPNKRSILNLFQYGVLKKLVRQQNVQVVIAEHSYAGWLAWLLRLQTAVPFVIHSHNIEAKRFQETGRWWWKIYALYEKWIHKKADFSFFISDADKKFAVTKWKLDPLKCATITYGVELALSDSAKDTAAPKAWGFEKVLYFNGTLDYKPNLYALHVLIYEILPRLEKAQLSLILLVTGNRASTTLQQTLVQHPRIRYLAYVPDVAAMYQQAHLFVNPMRHPSGVKTKVIEAIANHCTVVSTDSGAAGLEVEACGSKLVTVADGDWDAFASAIVAHLEKKEAKTTALFFETYLWNNIAAKAAQQLLQLASV